MLNLKKIRSEYHPRDTKAVNKLHAKNKPIREKELRELVSRETVDLTKCGGL